MSTQDRFPSFRQLQCLVALDDVRHFGLAADTLGVSQPSLSMQFSNLEATLGIKLAERGRSGVKLTPGGREIADRARKILIDVQEVCDLARAARGQNGLLGTLRLGTSPTLGPYILPQVIKRLHRQYPDLKLYVREGTPQELNTDLTYGHHDFILSPLPLASRDLTITRLFVEPLYLVVAKDHRLSGKSMVDASDLSGLKVLAPSPQYLLYDQIKSICAEVGAELAHEYEGTSLDTINYMVGMGLGVSFLPSLYVQAEISKQAEVRAIPFKGQGVSRTIAIAWRRHSGISRSLSMITKVIREVGKTDFKNLKHI
jgi:LysR family hydrogen peroxide-inducible transcriptional activator